MPSVTYTCYMGNTNKDYKTGASLNEYFSRSGTAPSGNATINSVSLYLSSIKTYSSRGTYLTIGGLGTSGVLSLNESVHSETVSFSPSGNILNFAGGSVSISLNTQQSTTANLVNFRDGCVLTITVNYTESASVSTASISPSSVQVGGTISLSIYASSGTYHTATWTLGSYSSGQTISAGVAYASFTIPTSWAGAISGTSAIGRVTLYTYTTSGSLVGSNSYTFTVTVSTAASAPTIGSVTVTHIPGNVPTAWGVYLQGKSKVKITVSGVSAATGSSISTYRFAGGGYSWSSSTDTSYTTGFLTTSGTNTFTVTVTDSRGLSASKSVSINVEPYEAPAVLSLTTHRSLQSGAQSETGAYIFFNLVTSYSTVGGKNTRTMLVGFKRLGADTWSSNYTIPNDGGWVIPANLTETDDMPYQIRIVISDALSSITQYYDVAGTKYTMYFPSGGRNVSIGMAGTRTDALEINSAWKIYHGSTDLVAKITAIKPISEGGTGATTAAGALANLGAAAASHVHAASAITSGVLPVARGGTGASALTANYA